MASEFKDGRKKIALFTRKREIDMTMKIQIFKNGELYWDNDHGVYTDEVKVNDSVDNKLDITSKLDLEEIEEKKEQLAKLEAKSIVNEEKIRKYYEDMRRETEEFKKKKAEEFHKEELKPELVIEVPAINPAPPRINKYFAPKPERPARDLENTMHNKALEKLSEDMKKPQNTVKINPIHIETKVSEPVKIDTDGDIKLEEKPVEEKNDMLLTIDQIKTLGEFIGEAAADIESVVGTEDAYTYNEILELDKQFTRILKDLDDSKVMTIEELLPEVFYAYIDSDIKKDNEVRVGDFRKALGDELANAATIILNIKLDIESEFEEEDEEEQPKVRRRRMSTSDRY